TNLTGAVVGNSGNVSLAWKDNSDNETGFQVERSTDGANFAIIGTAAANTTSYRDSTAAKGQRYYYRVCAKNNVGLSGYSNVVTTPTATPTPTPTATPTPTPTATPIPTPTPTPSPTPTATPS